MRRRNPYRAIRAAISETGASPPSRVDVLFAWLGLAVRLIVGGVIAVLAFPFSLLIGAFALMVVVTSSPPRELAITRKQRRRRWERANSTTDLVPEHARARSIAASSGAQAAVEYVNRAFEGQKEPEILQIDALRRLGSDAARDELERRAVKTASGDVPVAATAAACAFGDDRAGWFAVRMLDDPRMNVRDAAFLALSRRADDLARAAFEQRIPAAGRLEVQSLRRAIARIAEQQASMGG